MTPMKRLCDDTLSADAARILRSAEMDAPSSPDVQEARIIEAYGVAQPALLSSGLGLGSRRRRKWAALGGMLVVGSAIFVAWPPGAANAPAAKTNIEVSAMPITPIAEERCASSLHPTGCKDVASAEAAQEPTVRVEDLPAAPEAAKVAPRPAVVVGDELAAIDAARAALRSGEPADALARINACRGAFPHPHYTEEADALEVQALAAEGRLDEARAKAALFLRAHPESPYEQRVRAETQP